MEEIKMKDSGIKWIGQIPEGWNIKRLKYCVNCLDGKRIPIDAGLREEGPYPYWGAGSIQDYVNNYLFDEEIILLGEDGAPFFDKYRPVSFLVSEKVWVNNHIHVLKGKKDFFNKFIVYFLNCVDYQEYINGSVLNKLTQENMNNIPLILPSFDEQQKIADFLDKKCANIDEIISKTEKQIEVLEQYKKSLITETVTKGLKNSKLINSDIKWIGEIPFDWNTKKIKYVATLKGRIGWQGLTSDEYQDEGPYLITGVDFLDGQINWENCVHIPEKRWTEAVDIRIKENDLLITKDGTVGKVALVKNLKDKASLNSGVLLINLEEEYDKKYLFWVLQSDIFWKWFSYTNSGNSTIIHLYQHDFDNFEYPIPPMKEQKEIAAFLDIKCEKTDKIIKQQKESLETLKKYKQSLIYEYVTGKKRV